MFKILCTSIAMLACLVTLAQPPKGPAKAGMTFGQKITAAGSVDVNSVAAQLLPGKTSDVKVKGKVVEVCTEMGCWLKMETANGNMMVKMKDHSFFVPTDLNGKEVVVDGSAKMTETPVDELRHYAVDAGKTKDEIAAITEPKKEIVLTARGVLVLK